jgi:hypothetical protein
MVPMSFGSPRFPWSFQSLTQKNIRSLEEEKKMEENNIVQK